MPALRRPRQTGHAAPSAESPTRAPSADAENGARADGLGSEVEASETPALDAYFGESVLGDPSAPRKAVSGRAMGRLAAAQAAVDETKRILAFGAGNQYSALNASSFNSYFRMAAMRDPEAWEMAPAVEPLADAYPEALTTAKAGLAQGGNCGEHAAIAFDFLRRNVPGEHVNRADKSGLDHAFVIIGDTSKDADHELVVSDPWPSQATATLWEDHFAFTADRAELNIRNTAVDDPQDVAAAIAAGLKLTAKGIAMLNQALTDEVMEKELKQGTQGDHPWIWNHPDAAAEKYAYVAEEGQTAHVGAPAEAAPEEAAPEEAAPSASDLESAASEAAAAPESSEDVGFGPGFRPGRPGRPGLGRPGMGRPGRPGMRPGGPPGRGGRGPRGR